MNVLLRQQLQPQMKGASGHARPNAWLLLVLLFILGSAPAGRAIASGPALRLSKTASVAGPVVLGDVFTYRLCYQNTGDEAAQSATLVDELPANLDYLPGSSTGVYDPAQHRLSWNLGELAPGPESCLDLGVRVARNDLPELGGVGNQAELLLINNALLSAAGAAPAAASHELLFSSIANPTVTKTASSASVFTTSPITFTLRLGNTGNAPATQVVLTDALSNYLEDISAGSSQGTATYDAAAHKVTAQVGTLAPGSQAVITIKARIKAYLPAPAPVTFSNSAIVTFAEGNQRDSNRVQVLITGPPPPPEIPEPATVLLLLGGLAGLAGWMRRARTTGA